MLFIVPAVKTGTAGAHIRQIVCILSMCSAFYIAVNAVTYRKENTASGATYRFNICVCLLIGITALSELASAVVSASGIATIAWASNIPGWDGQWFYFDVTGEMQTGWKNNIPGYEGQWFCFTSNGTMATGWQLIDGDWHYFSASGFMYTNCTTPDGFTVDAEGKLVL